MIYFRRASERGKVDLGWLQSRHSFSFGHYYDPQHMGFGVLRVINEDTVAPGKGFATHGHRDMEIISYVISGALAHKDSQGNQTLIPAGDVQHMSAGRGIMHSEYNGSNTEPSHFLQIWIKPAKKGRAPSYQQFTPVQENWMTPLVTPHGSENSLIINQDASIYRIQLKQGDCKSLHAGERKGYLHVISGLMTAGVIKLGPGDAIGLGINCNFELNACSDVEALWFDLPAF